MHTRRALTSATIPPWRLNRAQIDVISSRARKLEISSGSRPSESHSGLDWRAAEQSADVDIAWEAEVSNVHAESMLSEEEEIEASTTDDSISTAQAKETRHQNRRKEQSAAIKMTRKGNYSQAQDRFQGHDDPLGLQKKRRNVADDSSFHAQTLKNIDPNSRKEHSGAINLVVCPKKDADTYVRT